MTFTREFAKFIVNHHFDQLSEEVISLTKLSILDWLGSAIAGGKEKPAKIVSDALTQFDASVQATNFTNLTKTSAYHAAHINGAASHILEVDDVHKGSILHAGASIIPAAFAVAEWKELSGKQLIEAVALGFEVAIRIGEAVTPSHYETFHTTGTVGTFGAAAAVSKLLCLTEDEVVHALGSAGTQAAGLWEFIEDGAMSKQLHPAKASANGLLSAVLAEKGFTAASEILEGRRGFFQGLVKEVKPQLLFRKLGERYKIVENSFKIHSCCRHIHPTLDCLQEIVRNHIISLQNLERVVVETYQVALNITDKPNPRTVYEAKFSLQYAAALMLVKEKAGLDTFIDGNLFDEQIRSVLPKVELQVDSNLDALYPEKWPARVTVYFSNGTQIVQEAFYPKGDPENPASEQELLDKFFDLSERVLSKEAANHLSMQIMRLCEIDNAAWIIKQGLQNKMKA
ncbi:MmgE/PrpD family protein [Bacillus sp. JJ722]|uniref:MmgE/PrpD family protein n=1 Tax=Bacillus sp. JJ722 TaxID=3122973 RepID=UPI002FFE3215